MRKEKGLTQKRLAEILGITATRLNYWEKNKREPDFYNFKNLYQALEVNPDWLLSTSEVKKKPIISDDELQGLINQPRQAEILSMMAKMSEAEFDRFYVAFFALFGEPKE